MPPQSPCGDCGCRGHPAGSQGGVVAYSVVDSRLWTRGNASAANAPLVPSAFRCVCYFPVLLMERRGGRGLGAVLPSPCRPISARQCRTLLPPSKGQRIWVYILFIFRCFGDGPRPRAGGGKASCDLPQASPSPPPRAPSRLSPPPFHTVFAQCVHLWPRGPASRACVGVHFEVWACRPSTAPSTRGVGRPPPHNWHLQSRPHYASAAGVGMGHTRCIPPLIPSPEPQGRLGDKHLRLAQRCPGQRSWSARSLCDI